MRQVAVWIFAAILCGLSAAATAQTPRLGQTVRGAIELGAKQIPLADGDWRVASITTDSKPAEFGAYGVLENIVLFQADDAGNVRAAVEIFANALPVVDGWGISKECDRSDIHLAVTRYKAGWDGLCFFIYNAVASDDGRSLSWLQALGYARAAKLKVPEQWMAAGIRVANRRDLVDIRYYFAPEAWGFPATAAKSWKDSAWAPKQVEADPAKVAFVRSIAEWLNAVDGYYLSGIKSRFDRSTSLGAPRFAPAQRPAAGAAAAAGPPALSIKTERLKALDKLFEAKLISGEDYQKQRDELMAQDPNPGATVVDPATVALYKTVAYRPIVSFANIFIDYYWIGQPFATGVLLFLQVTINSTKFYFHELAWEGLGVKGARRDSARTLDFTYVGLNN